MFSIMLIHCSEFKERRYCGVVVEKYLLHKNNGGTHNIVLHSDSLNRNINISVKANTYINLEKGQRTCFDLTDYQIE